MTYDLCSSLLGKEHPASIMAKEDISALFPELALLRETRIDKHFEIVKNFDKTSQYLVCSIIILDTSDSGNATQ